MVKTSIRLAGACRFIRSAALTLVMFAGFSWSGMQAAQADPFLDEVVGFTGQVFFIEHKVPALVIGVVRGGEISVYGLGERAGEGSKAPDGNTVMRVGSITKAFTGQVFANLVAENKVRLTEPLTETWPELAANANTGVKDIRLIDLATHSGGLPREAPHELGSEKDPFAPITVRAFADWLKKEPLLFRPGRSVLYSNFGFDLLALGLSKAANTPFPALLKRHITDPLHMKDTVYELSEEQKQRLMQGHGFDGTSLPHVPTGSVIVGSGGLYSTPNDLLNWMRWHLDRLGENASETRLLDHALYLMRGGLETVSGMDESGHMDAMGLGWVAMMPKGNRPFILQKAGGIQGVFSYIAFAPTRGVAVFMAINKFDFAAAVAMAGVANDLIATLAPR